MVNMFDLCFRPRQPLFPRRPWAMASPLGVRHGRRLARRSPSTRPRASCPTPAGPRTFIPLTICYCWQTGLFGPTSPLLPPTCNWDHLAVSPPHSLTHSHSQSLHLTRSNLTWVVRLLTRLYQHSAMCDGIRSPWVRRRLTSLCCHHVSFNGDWVRGTFQVTLLEFY